MDLVAKEILKLPLKDGKIEDILVKYFIKAVKKGQFNQMYFVASISCFLKPYSPSLVVKLMDHLIEEIVYHLENNRLEERQKRIQVIKFMSELFNYEILDYD